MLFGQRLALAGRVEFFARIGPRRFEQPVATVAAFGFRQDERFVDERCEHVEDVELVEIEAASDRDCALEREPVDENAETPKQRAFPLVEQIVAPVDQRTQRLLARQHVAAPARQDAEALIEPAMDLLRAENLDARRSEFDRKGIPSRRRQISLTARALSSFNSKR